jgi:hypothetical protein
MFMTIVFILLMVLLIIAGGAALNMGVFKAHRQETSFIKKAIGGVVSYGISAAVWLCMYSYHYMQW